MLILWDKREQKPEAESSAHLEDRRDQASLPTSGTRGTKGTWPEREELLESSAFLRRPRRGAPNKDIKEK